MADDYDEFEYQLKCLQEEQEAAKIAAPAVASAPDSILVPSTDQPQNGSISNPLSEATSTTLSEPATSTTLHPDYIDPKDGTVYQWNEELQGMFPRMPEDFDLEYKLQYGGEPPSLTNSTAAETPATSDVYGSNKRQNAAAALHDDADDDDPESSSKKQRSTTTNKNDPKPPPEWFDVDDSHNHNVYVSNLPLDITMDEFADVMSKAGIVMKEPKNGQLKLKLYRNKPSNDADSTPALKGDGLCCYLKIESVQLAIKLLDGYKIRADSQTSMNVQVAKFEKKGEFDPVRQKQRRLRPSDKKKLLKQEQKLLAWQPDRLRGERMQCEKTVVLKNMFDPMEFKAEPALLLDYQNDLREECQQFGLVKKATVYDRHPEGIATVLFDTAQEADACIARMNGRWFNRKQLVATAWDGKSKYKVEETQQEAQERLQQWEKLLDNEDLSTATSNSKEIAALINPEFADIDAMHAREIVHEQHHHPSAFHDAENEYDDGDAVESAAVAVATVEAASDAVKNL